MNKDRNLGKRMMEISHRSWPSDHELFLAGSGNDEGLSQTGSNMITVETLVALNRTEQLSFHLNFALENGVTQEEIG